MNTKALRIIIILAFAGVAVYGVMTLKPAMPAPVQEAPQSTDAPQGKLDINAVCQGALAYMTFPDGASADTFVAECKEGKHPEVVEKYKADMNLGAGAAI